MLSWNFFPSCLNGFSLPVLIDLEIKVITQNILYNHFDRLDLKFTHLKWSVNCSANFFEKKNKDWGYETMDHVVLARDKLLKPIICSLHSRASIVHLFEKSKWIANVVYEVIINVAIKSST